MGNLALYRKYRPDNFSSVYDQETIVKILKNQINSDHVGHAYLFSGIRGTGKTTLAKIFARAVNCENPINGEPCETCRTCLALKEPSNMDIIEIDAASNRGIDEIRELRETISYPPTIGKYKVYIIDEVHMLTKEAFNALLKTLEEPPSHAIFILATTEPHKLPATILSRCQKYSIKPISIQSIFDQMKEICKKENISIEDGALYEIASRAGHSMRDALSLLDQCMDLELPGDLITKKEVEDFLGVSPKDQLKQIATLISEKNATELINSLNQFRKEGREDQILLEDLSNFFQQLLYYKITKIKDQNYDEIFDSLISKFSDQDLYKIIDTLLNAYSKLRFNTLTSIITDSALLNLCIEDTTIQNEPVSTPTATVKVETAPFDADPVTPIKRAKPPVINTILEEVPIYTPSAEELAHLEASIATSGISDFKDESSTRSEVKPNESSKPKGNQSLKEQDKKQVDSSSNPTPKISSNNIKNELIDLAKKRNEALLSNLLESSDIIYNKHGLFILLESRHRFMFEASDFQGRLQKLVNEVIGHSTKVFPKIKEDYYAFLNKKKQGAVKQQKSLEEQMKEVIGPVDYKYTKIND